MILDMAMEQKRKMQEAKKPGIIYIILGYLLKKWKIPGGLEIT